MYLEIKPATPLDGRMLTLNGARMGVNRDPGTLTASVSKRDGLLDPYYIAPDGTHPLLTNRDERDVVNKKYAVEYKLSHAGASFLTGALDTLGALEFTFYEDDQDPFKKPALSEKPTSLTQGYAVPIGRRVSVSPLTL